MNRLASIFFLTIALAASAFSQSSVKVGSVAPVFAGTSLDGTTYDLNELRGNVVVITFWSTKCLICQQELPKLNTVTDRYNSSKVVFLALTMEDEDKIARFLQRNPFKFQIMPNSFGVVLQYADRDKNGHLDMGFPSFFVIDQEGLVQYRSSGYDKTPELVSHVSQLLDAK
jgi:peroxiredoxin